MVKSYCDDYIHGVGRTRRCSAEDSQCVYCRLNDAESLIVRLDMAWDDLLEDLELRGLHDFEPYVKSKQWYRLLEEEVDHFK